ncbi:hypothetical protein D8I24_8042 [Cupriavidus necator H850]|nr:hypothetical protein D8I24_8042 [Cupriavidus necator H850]
MSGRICFRTVLFFWRRGRGSPRPCRCALPDRRRRPPAASMAGIRFQAATGEQE